MRHLESQGRQVLPGLWQLNRTTWIVRAQPHDPARGKPVNRRRLLKNTTRAEAIAFRERLMRRTPDKFTVSTATASILPEPGRTSAEASTTPTSPPTLSDFAESWLKRKIDRGDLEESAAVRYATDLGHLSKRLLEAPVSPEAVTADAIENWMIASRKKYHPNTINCWRATLQLVLDDAENRGLIPRNPAKRVAPLKVEVDLRQRDAPRPEQLRIVLGELAKGDRVVSMAALVQAAAGSRWGETSALQWDDFDEASGILAIRRKAVRGTLKPTTKTNRGREVGMPETVRLALIEYRQWLASSEHPGRKSGLMFPSSVGTPLGSPRISGALRAACKRAGIAKAITSHGLRRAMTDMLRRSKVDPVVAKAIVGHATDRMREHYSTVGAEELQEAASHVESALFGVKPEPEAAE